MCAFSAMLLDNLDIILTNFTNIITQVPDGGCFVCLLLFGCGYLSFHSGAQNSSNEMLLYKQYGILSKYKHLYMGNYILY